MNFYIFPARRIFLYCKKAILMKILTMSSFSGNLGANDSLFRQHIFQRLQFIKIFEGFFEELIQR